MSNIKVTKEMVDEYLRLHEIIWNRVSEVKNILEKIYPEQYGKDFAHMEYYDPGEELFRWGGWYKCMGYSDWESDGIPTEYIYNDELIEKLKEEVRIKKEKEEKEKFAKEQKRKEEEEKAEWALYEKLKNKFEKKEDSN